jgi:hypothetical protein
VQLVGEGKTSKDIAAMLGMSLKTAETHRSNIMLKLRLHSTVELVLYAVRNEIIHVQLPSFYAARSSQRKRSGARCPSRAQLRIVVCLDSVESLKKFASPEGGESKPP